MKSIFTIAVFSLLQVIAFGQTSGKTVAPAATGSKTISLDDVRFEKYCHVHALQLITVPQGKSTDGLKIAGELTLLNNDQATYRDYGITLKEEETQYYKIAGSGNQLMMVQSLFRLRLEYQNSQQR